MAVNILESKMFKGSPNQDKILAAMMDPINNELKVQLARFVDVPEKPEPEPDSKPVEEEQEDVEVEDTKADAKGDGEDEEEVTSDSGHDGSEHPSDEEESKEEVAESTKLDDAKSTVVASSVTPDVVAGAVEKIPGTLNMIEGCEGATHAIMKGGSDNEVWIYYASDVDINKKLEGINRELAMAGYYFLTFNRVSRDDNAVVYSINWVSNYFNPTTYSLGTLDHD